MSNYVFILGKEKSISIAELITVFGEESITEIANDCVSVISERSFNQNDFDMLGGVIKMGEVLEESSKEDLLDTIFTQLQNKHSGSKLNFGISLYGESIKNLRSLLIDIKRRLNTEKVSSRFANQDFQNISTAQHKGLKKKGVEFLVVKSDSSYLIAEVTAIQDIDSYSKRDFDKPFRDMRVGMLPPKLAQVMINLTGIEDGTIWDPFCGGGVLVMEGLFMGYDMLGSDINEDTLDGAEQNVDWIKYGYNLHAKVDLFAHDATTPLLNRKFDAIACEGYLGPPQEQLLTETEADNVTSHLHSLYVNFFQSLKEINFKGPIVIALPFYKCDNNEEKSMDRTIDEIKQMGFVPEKLINESVQLKYRRENQVVGREIFKFVSIS